MKIGMAVLPDFLSKMTTFERPCALIRTGVLLKRLQFGNKACFGEKVLDFSLQVVYSGIK